MNNRIRYTFDEVMRDIFYQMPKFLFAGELKKLNNDARVLYSVLKDRHELSIKNKWVNENNEVYLIFSREEMCDLLGVSENTILKAIKILKNFNLIEEERQGLGKPNKIYLLALETLENTQTLKYCGSRNSIFEEQQPQNLRPSNTELNNNNHIENESSQSSHMSMSDSTTELSTKEKTYRTMTRTLDNDTAQQNSLEKEKELSQTATPTTANGLKSPSVNTQYPLDHYTAYKQIIQDNISYSHYLHNRHTDIELIDELINCMLDVIFTKGDTVKINGEEKSRNMVISQYLKINSMDIDHILDRYKGQHHKITHLHSYLKTMLYTVKQESGHYYTNAVRADSVVW